MKYIKFLLFYLLFIDISNAEIIAPTISNAFGTASRTSATVLVPSNSWSSSITIPSSPISSPLAVSSYTLGTSYADVYPALTSYIPDEFIRPSLMLSSIPSVSPGIPIFLILRNVIGVTPEFLNTVSATISAIIFPNR